MLFFKSVLETTHKKKIHGKEALDNESTYKQILYFGRLWTDLD